MTSARTTDSTAVTTSLLSAQNAASGSRTVAAGMARQPIRAITIDALGTLLELLPPAPRLQAELRSLGVEVSLEQAGRAMKAEIGFYRGHLWMGRDAAGVGAPRRPCAEVRREALELELGLGEVEAALLVAIRFEPFPEAVPALRALR